MSNISKSIVHPLFLMVTALVLLSCTPQAAEEPADTAPESAPTAQTEPEALEPDVAARDQAAYPAPESAVETEAEVAGRAETEGYPAPSTSNDSGQGANIGSVVVVQTEPESSGTDPNRELADADVVFVSASQTGEGLWNFSVTVAHPDTGWEDYADGWDVVLPDGTVAKANESDPFTRLLLHPHETEQPFTRSQSNIPIPATVEAVTVRAHDLVHGWGGAEVVVNLTPGEGDGYEVR